MTSSRVPLPTRALVPVIPKPIVPAPIVVPKPTVPVPIVHTPNPTVSKPIAEPITKKFPTVDLTQLLKSFEPNINTATVRVINVKWRVAQNTIKPLIFYDPEDIEWLDGRLIPAHNAQFIVDNNIGPDSLILIVQNKTNLPNIISVVKSTEAALPDKKIFGEYMWDTHKIDLIK